jgi:hypothetical protein
MTKFCKDESPYVVTCDTTYGDSSLQNFRGPGRSPKQHVDGWNTSSKDWAHMVLHLPHTEGGVGETFNCITKDTAFYTTTSRLCLGWVLSLRYVRSCGYLKMIFGTRPHGHHPRLCSFVTFTPRSLTSTTAKRFVCRLRHRSTQELVID